MDKQRQHKHQRRQSKDEHTRTRWNWIVLQTIPRHSHSTSNEAAEMMLEMAKKRFTRSTTGMIKRDLAWGRSAPPQGIRHVFKSQSWRTIDSFILAILSTIKVKWYLAGHNLPLLYTWLSSLNRPCLKSTCSPTSILRLIKNYWTTKARRTRQAEQEMFVSLVYRDSKAIFAASLIKPVDLHLLSKRELKRTAIFRRIGSGHNWRTCSENVNIMPFRLRNQ